MSSYVGYNNPYNNNFSNIGYMQELQSMRDRIDKQITQMQQQPVQQQTPAINQTFQLSNPINNNDYDAKSVTSIDEVKSTLTIRNTLFVDKEMSTLWLKDASGNIKAYALTEIVEIDPKDKQIQDLQKQIDMLKGEIQNAKSNVNADVISSTTTEEPKSVPVNRTSKK